VPLRNYSLTHSLAAGAGGAGATGAGAGAAGAGAALRKCSQ